MLNGGRAFVPDQAWKAFLGRCAFDIANKLPTYYTEVETDPKHPRRLCCDLDYICADSYVSGKQIRNHARCMHDVVNLFFPEGDNSAIILIAPQKKCFKTIQGAQRSVFKVGVHIVWYNTIVDKAQSLRIRASWLTRLESMFGSAPNVEGSWSTIVDEAIYNTGLRLPGSAKCRLCPLCKNRATDMDKCVQCEGRGRLYEEGSYMPLLVMTGTDGSLAAATDLCTDWDRMLQLCTVRIINGVLRSDYTVPRNAPAHIPNCSEKKKKKEEGEEHAPPPHVAAPTAVAANARRPTSYALSLASKKTKLVCPKSAKNKTLSQKEAPRKRPSRHSSTRACPKSIPISPSAR